MISSHFDRRPPSIDDLELFQPLDCCPGWPESPLVIIWFSTSMPTQVPRPALLVASTKITLTDGLPVASIEIPRPNLPVAPTKMLQPGLRWPNFRNPSYDIDFANSNFHARLDRFSFSIKLLFKRQRSLVLDSGRAWYITHFWFGRGVRRFRLS